MPEPQLICTVKATMASPMPSRRAATRAGFISSAMTLTQPRMTWSKTVGANGWRANSGRPHCTARSTGVNGPGPERALRNGVGCRRRYKPVAPSARRPLLTKLLEELMHVGGFFVNRRNRLRREVVDLDHFRRRLMRRGELFALGLRDDALLH